MITYIIFPQVEDYTACCKIHLFHNYQRELFFAVRTNMHYYQLSLLKKTVGKKKCLYSFFPADVINHKSRDRWNCCRDLEISTVLPKPLHLLFCDTAKQTKIAWYSSSIFMFMFICLFCPQHCLVCLLFGLKNRLDWD